MNDEATLAAALRALPDATPPADGWAKVAARSRRRRNLRRSAWLALPAACAAAITLFMGLPHAPSASLPPSHAVAAQAASPAPTSLDALQASSAQWQAWVQQLGANGAPLDGRALASAVSLQDRIGLIDLQLSGTRDAARAADLWRQRITLLQQLGLLHLQPQLVASDAHNAHPGTISL